MYGHHSFGFSIHGVRCGDRTTFASVFIVPGIDCPRDPQQQHYQQKIRWTTNSRESYWLVSLCYFLSKNATYNSLQVQLSCLLHYSMHCLSICLFPQHLTSWTYIVHEKYFFERTSGAQFYTETSSIYMGLYVWVGLPCGSTLTKPNQTNLARHQSF